MATGELIATTLYDVRMVRDRAVQSERERIAAKLEAAAVAALVNYPIGGVVFASDLRALKEEIREGVRL